MDIDINKLLEGKATKIKNDSYLATKDYVSPFLDRLSHFTDDFRVKVELPKQVTLDKNGELDTADITYNRVWIQGVLPDEYAFTGHQRVLGMVYGLDVRKPVCKIYTGALNMACTNLCIFNPDAMVLQDIVPDKPLNFKCVSDLMGQVDTIKVNLQKMIDQSIDNSPEVINECLGRWIKNSIHESYDNGYSKVKLAASAVIDAYKLLFEKEDSPYYTPGDVPMFTVYNAFTQILTNGLAKDSFNYVEKTLLLTNILELGTV